MSDFIKLLQLLEAELAQHEKLLKLLTEERAAIVKLNHPVIEEITQKKGNLLEEGKALEVRRNEILGVLYGARSRREPIKLTEIVQRCASEDLKKRLQQTGEELRKTAHVVQEMNKHNAKLIQQSLGMINATVAIIYSAGHDELPTYGDQGKLLKQEQRGSTRRIIKSA